MRRGGTRSGISLSKFLSHWIRYSESLELTVPYKREEHALSPQGRSRKERGQGKTSQVLLPYRLPATSELEP
jgi:hypothetical protein